MRKKQNGHHSGPKKQIATVLVFTMGMMFAQQEPISMQIYATEIDSTKESTREQPSNGIKSTSDKIQEVQKDIQELEEEKQQADEEVSQLNSRKTYLLQRMEELDTQLRELSTEIETTQQEFEQKKEEVQKSTKKLEKAEKKEQKQYEQMKVRIQYIYQNGSDSYMEALINVGSFREMLNRMEYVTELADYDNNRMSSYHKAVNDVKRIKNTLAQQEQELKELWEKQQDTQKKLLNTIENTQRVVEVNSKEINKAQEEAQAIQQKIDQKKAYEQQLELQRITENSSRMQQINNMEQVVADAKNWLEQTGGVIGPGYSEMDFALMAAIIDCEAEGETYEGKLAVGSVVMNRVMSPQFPNTIAGVIYSPGQFAPVTSGRFAVMLASNGATQECRNAAYEVLNGRITNNFLFFRTIIPGFPATIIDHQMFY